MRLGSPIAVSAIAMALSEVTADYTALEKPLRVKEDRKPSGKNRDKVKAARKQRRKQK